MGIPEWGLWQASYQDGAGGDDPYYIQQMYLWVMNPANNVAYQSYFDLATDDNHEVYPPTSYPLGSAEYQQLFGLHITDASPTISATSVFPGHHLVITDTLTATHDASGLIWQIAIITSSGNIAVVKGANGQPIYNGFVSQQANFLANRPIKVDFSTQLPSGFSLGSYTVNVLVYSASMVLLFSHNNALSFSVVAQ